MEGRYSYRNRYGDNLGSIKSRIQAREDRSSSGSDITKVKQARQKTEARAFRSAEGVKSRMSKFSEKLSAPSSNESPKSPRNRNQKTNGEKLPAKKGDISSTSERRKLKVEKDAPPKSPVTSKIDQEKAEELKASMPSIEPANDSKLLAKTDEDLNNKENAKATVVNEQEEKKLSFADLTDESQVNGTAANDLHSSLSESSSVKNEQESVNEPEEVAEEVKIESEKPVDTKASEADVTAETSDSSSNFVSTSATPKTADDVTSGRESQVRIKKELDNADKTDSKAAEQRPVARQRKKIKVDGLKEESPKNDLTQKTRKARKAQTSAKSSESGSLASTPDRTLSPELSDKKLIIETPQATTSESTDVLELPSTDIPAETLKLKPDQVLAEKEVESQENIDVNSAKIQPSATKLDEAAVEKKLEASKKKESRVKNDKKITQEASSTTASPVETSRKNLKKKPQEATSKFTMDNIEDCKDIGILEKMLDEAQEYDQRRRIRSVIRALKKGGATSKPKEMKATSSSRSQTRTAKTEVKTQREATKSTKAASASTESRQSKTKSSESRSSDLSKVQQNKNPPDPKALAEKYGLTSETKDSSKKKVGSIFDREEEPPKKSSSRVEMERRQAQRQREMMRNRAPQPSAESKEARKKFVSQLEVDGGSSHASNANKASGSIVPNANNVKNKMLRWCQSKTRGYEHVEISNYSSSWADGMAFCALIHNFFPDAFDFDKLDPKNRFENFNLAFTTAEKKADIPILLDVNDLVTMDEPDWKCIYTYLTEFYKHIYELGMK